MENRNPNCVCTIGCIQRSWWAVLAIVLCFAMELSTKNAKAADKTQQPAFPGAEGFGQFARGGRGGDVYYVTNLADDGPGSLRHGIRTATGPRTILFSVSGTIALKSRLVVDKSYITIAGRLRQAMAYVFETTPFESRTRRM